MELSMKCENYVAVNTDIKNINMDNDEVLRVIKANKIYEFDENTYAKLKDCKLKDGTIEVDMMSQLLPHAPDFARGFIGIAFRINEDDSEFESFYIRPTNSINATDDPVRQAHGCQYFAYPKYTFAYFRENGITEYEAPIHNELGEWIHLKAVIKNNSASFYLNNEKESTLVVKELIHKDACSGHIGFFVDIGTEAFFKNLKVDME